MNKLDEQNCTHQSGSPLNKSEVDNYLTELKLAWQVNDKHTHIEFDFTFKNFHETIEFVNALAWVANQQDHHPDLEVGYKHCLIRFSTHSVGGLSINDFICAYKIEKLLP